MPSYKEIKAAIDVLWECVGNDVAFDNVEDDPLPELLEDISDMLLADHPDKPIACKTCEQSARPDDGGDGRFCYNCKYHDARDFDYPQEHRYDRPSNK